MSKEWRWLRKKLGWRRYLFWTVAGKVLPTRMLVWLLGRIPDEEQDKDEP